MHHSAVASETLSATRVAAWCSG